MPSNSIVKLYETTEGKLSTIPVVTGQMIFVRDSHTIYMDSHGLRVSYSNLTVLDTEADRTSILAPVQGTYYVQETHILWSYGKDGWWQLTPENLNPIFCGSLEDFPKVGSDNTLYVDKDVIYKWDSVLSKYLAVANMTQWEDIPT